MPKKFIPLVLLITLTLGPVSGVFGSVMDKIKGYSIYLPGSNRELDVVNRNLWFSSTFKEVEEYAAAVENSPYNPMGANAVFAYSMIGADDVMKTLKSGTEIGLVNSPPEYYFTDMVFIQQKYEEALVDLYYFRAECSTFEDRPIMDEAIAGTYWVAQQNGVSYTEEQIEEKFLEQLDEQLDEQLEPVASEFKSRFADIDKNLDEYTDAFVSALKEYYLDPNLETFENVINIAYEFD